MHNRTVFKNYYILVFTVFIVPLTGICFYIAFLYPQATQEETMLFQAGVLMFGGLVAFAIYRTFYLGLLHLKKLPLLKVDVGKVCKTCGGSSYVPR